MLLLEEHIVCFVQPHGYPAWGQADVTAKISPFYNSKDTWAVPQPVLIGEHWDLKNDGVPLTAEDLKKLKSNNYAGQ
jgi:hypothetical protein